MFKNSKSYDKKFFTKDDRESLVMDIAKNMKEFYDDGGENVFFCGIIDRFKTKFLTNPTKEFIEIIEEFIEQEKKEGGIFENVELLKNNELAKKYAENYVKFAQGYINNVEKSYLTKEEQEFFHNLNVYEFGRWLFNTKYMNKIKEAIDEIEKFTNEVAKFITEKNKEQWIDIIRRAKREIVMKKFQENEELKNV